MPMARVCKCAIKRYQSEHSYKQEYIALLQVSLSLTTTQCSTGTTYIMSMWYYTTANIITSVSTAYFWEIRLSPQSTPSLAYLTLPPF